MTGWDTGRGTSPKFWKSIADVMYKPTHYIEENFFPDPKLKLNETGRQLRLFAVDRWDSGLYMCSTSLTEPPHHNVTVRVRGPPVVTAPRHGDRDVGFVARQVRGHPAKLRCKVSSILKSAG